MESQGSIRKASIVQDYVGSLSDKKKLAAIQQDSYDTQAADTLPEIGQLEFTHLQEAQYSSLFNKLRNKLDSFTKEWNADERNRDKTFNVFNQLTATKDEIQDSLQQMIERDGKIEVSLAKGE